MTREEAKKMLPIIQAWIEGKTLEYYDDNTRKWQVVTKAIFITPNKYRIKQEPKYRPFNTQDECWKEMQKHQPFGWIKKKGNYVNITLIPKESSYNLDLKNFTFADGTPFGIKEE